MKYLTFFCALSMLGAGGGGSNRLKINSFQLFIKLRPMFRVCAVYWSKQSWLLHFNFLQLYKNEVKIS